MSDSDDQTDPRDPVERKSDDGDVSERYDVRDCQAYLKICKDCPTDPSSLPDHDLQGKLRIIQMIHRVLDDDDNDV